MYRRIAILCKKELIQPFRNIPLMLFLLYLITMDPFWVGELTMDLKDFPMGVYDLDRSKVSHDLVERLRTPYFKITHYINEQKQIRELLTSGKVSMVMVIPFDFSKNLAKGRTANISPQVISPGCSPAVGGANNKSWRRPPELVYAASTPGYFNRMASVTMLPIADS